MDLKSVSIVQKISNEITPSNKVLYHSMGNWKDYKALKHSSRTKIPKEKISVIQQYGTTKDKY